MVQNVSSHDGAIFQPTFTPINRDLLVQHVLAILVIHRLVTLSRCGKRDEKHFVGLTIRR